MKKGIKFGVAGGLLLLGAITLSSCTASFCSPKDKAHMLYAFDFGVTAYYTNEDKPDEAIPLEGFNDVYYTAEYDNNQAVKKIVDSAIDQGYREPSIEYFIEMDRVVLDHALQESGITDTSNLGRDDIIDALDEYGYLKYYDTVNEKIKLWSNWDVYNQEVRQNIEVDQYPDADFLAFYKNQMNANIASYNSCIATTDGEYGYYGYGSDKTPIEIEGKDWGYAWKRGFLEGLLIYPIGWAIDGIVQGFVNLGMNPNNGGPQILAILFMTIIIRLIMMAITFKQTTGNTKMMELQPEIAKIQAKYPNNTKREKELMAMEMQKLYKKNKINPFTSILVMILQFPVFICVWGALSGSSWLSSGEFLGLRLSDSISSALFNGSNWVGPHPSAWTALVLFILMTAAQVCAMLLPQWIQKRNQKKVAKLGKNLTQKSQSNKMKWFTYIMLASIIFMGFFLASGMGVYWLIGAIMSIAQTLIMQAISNSRRTKKKKVGNK